LGSGLEYEAKKLEARMSECEEAFGKLRSKAEECSRALRELESGSIGPEELLSRLSEFLEVISEFEHELSHLYSSAASILAKLKMVE